MTQTAVICNLCGDHVPIMLSGCADGLGVQIADSFKPFVNGAPLCQFVPVNEARIHMCSRCFRGLRNAFQGTSINPPNERKAANLLLHQMRTTIRVPHRRKRIRSIQTNPVRTLRRR